MKVEVEFTGFARAVTNQKVICLELPEGTTYREIVKLLGQQFPDLIGLLIDRDGETFLSSNMFIVNDDMASPAMMMDESPKDGDRLILMSLITGG
ncbi:MAG: MoaD/ThiS family protein [Anaerolineales bacterium]|jgi:molybdopterin converting factor small subunit